MDTLKEERWQKDRDFFVAAAEKLGAEGLVQSANTDDARQIAQCENLLSQGVDALVIAPSSKMPRSKFVVARFSAFPA